MISFVHGYLQELTGIFLLFFDVYFQEMNLFLLKEQVITNCGHEVFICPANFSVQQVSRGLTARISSLPTTLLHICCN